MKILRNNGHYFVEAIEPRREPDGFLVFEGIGISHISRVQDLDGNTRDDKQGVRVEINQERLAITHKELADMLRCSTDTLDRRVDAGLIRPSKALSIRLYSIDEIRRFLKIPKSEMVLPFVEPTEEVYGRERREVARFLGVHVSSVDELVKRGLLHPFPKHLRPLFSVGEVKRFLAATL